MPVIHILNVTYGPTKLNACVSILLLHETAHTLRMGEVYDNVGHDKKDETVCVMERYDDDTADAFYLAVISGTKKPFCDSCEQAMKNYTKNSVINGNNEED